MPTLIHQNRAGLILLLIALILAFGVLFWETFVADPQLHKLEQSSNHRYGALAWSRDGLQIQLARHDSTNELNSWLSSLDIRNKTRGFVIDACGLRIWKYETSGLAVSIFHIPLWAILMLPTAGYFFWWRRRVQATTGTGFNRSKCSHSRLAC